MSPYSETVSMSDSIITSGTFSKSTMPLLRLWLSSAELTKKSLQALQYCTISGLNLHTNHMSTVSLPKRWLWFRWENVTHLHMHRKEVVSNADNNC